jgi:hypothetical protein
MTAYTAPTEIVPIFDSNNFIPDTDEGALTESMANALYLRKTVADTATALETFNAGIKTTTVNNIGDLTIGDTSNTLYLGSDIQDTYLMSPITYATDVKIAYLETNQIERRVTAVGAGIIIGEALGATDTIKLGSATSAVRNYGTLLCDGVMTATTGIATNNLNTTSTSSNLVIGSATNTGTIFINTIATNNTNADPAIAIGTNTGTRTIKINNGTNSVHCSSIDMAGSGINNVANTTGDINIGNLQTTGDLNIGTNVGRTSTSVINIGTGSTLVNPINIGSSTSDTTINGSLQSTGQATFDLVPHCDVIPTFSEDLTNKAYVDSRIASGGSNFFYFNYSVNSNLGSPIKQLGNSIVISTLQTVNKPALGLNSIAKFISDVGVPNITTIPSGIWELNQWGNQNNTVTPTGTIVYYFILSTYKPSTGVTTFRGTSGNSQVVDLATPNLYFASLSLGPISVDLEDRIVIEVFSLGAVTGGVNTLDSYYQGNYYSYLTCPIIEGTDLLNKNNSWTGTNGFGSTVTVPTLTFPSNTSNPVNSAYLTTNYVPNSSNTNIAGTKTFSSNILATGIGGATAGANFAFCGSTTSGAITMCNASVGGGIGIGQAASRTGAIGIGDGNACSHSLNLSNGGSHSGTVNILNGASCSGTINLASGAGTTPVTNVNIAAGTTSGVVTIGNSASTTALNGTTTIATLAINAVNRASTGLLEIGTNAFNTTLNISRSGVTTAILGGLSVATTSLFTGIATMTGPIVLGSNPSVNTQLGFLIPNLFPTTSALINSTDSNICSQSLGIGTWLLSYQFRLSGNPGGNISIFLVKIATGTSYLAQQTNYITENIPSGGFTARSGSAVIKLTAVTSVSLQYYVQSGVIINILGENTSPTDCTYLQCVRIG